ncbi:MAG TPA: hypothetical protein VK215_03965 [Acidimicrobiales bacterium]|nr:hypothetical protein [Acidimicrobiales bacterium]
MSVASQFSGTATLQLTSSTTYSQTVSATAQDVTVGGCVAVTGTPPTNGSAAGPVAARSVVISGAGSPCPFTGSTGFGGRGNGRFGGGGGFGGGGFGGGGFSLASTSGKVTAVSGSAVTLVGTGRIVGSVGASSVGSSSKPAQVEVSTSSATTYTKVESASHSAVVLGRCVNVFGSKAPSGTLTATSVSVRPAGPSGCGGFGGRGSGAGTGARFGGGSAS